MSKKQPEVIIIRKDLDGSTIRKTPCSIGYQVWLREKFLSFQMDLQAAHSILNHAQAN